MDNLATYKSRRVQKLIEERGCELLYLRAYSPDLNPITARGITVDPKDPYGR